MQVKRGETIMFNYVPPYLSQLPPSGEVAARAVVRKVLRQRGVAVVRVWNGRVSGPIAEQYDELEVLLAAAHRVKKRSKT